MAIHRGFGWVFFVFSIYTNAYGTSLVLEAYGDSVTAGLLANTNVTQTPDLNYVSRVITDLAMYALTDRRGYVIRHEYNSLSWPKLVGEKLLQKDEVLELRNYAVSGARTLELIQQVESAAAIPPGARVIAFFFFGNNDLCESEGSPAPMLGNSFKQDFRRGIKAWEARHKEATAYFMPVAELHKIYPILDGQLWYEGRPGTRSYSCVDSWTRMFPYCTNFYRLYQKRRLDEVLVPRIEAMNQSLKELVQELNSRSLRNEYRYLQPIKPIEFEKSYFAIDCYHLSTEGQKVVADEVVHLLPN